MFTFLLIILHCGSIYPLILINYYKAPKHRTLIEHVYIVTLVVSIFTLTSNYDKNLSPSHSEHLIAKFFVYLILSLIALYYHKKVRFKTISFSPKQHILAPLLEEIYFKEIFFKLSIFKTNLYLGVLIGALNFSVAHIPIMVKDKSQFKEVVNLLIVAFLFYLMSSMFFIYYRTIMAPFLLHVFFNCYGLP
eukprot:GAHX01002903.1.p1 GENE.GAHX01002903.1~~GAHX01002903.1.p1  ORF type:complete len:191 (-),score=15.98 GAHX01002903.1:299-871(-)